MTKVTAKLKNEGYRTEVSTVKHMFITDEPLEIGGTELGPNPGELLSASLASCSVATVKMYADKKGWKLEDIIIEVEFKKDPKEMKTVFNKKIRIFGVLTEEQKLRLYEIANRCPIHRILTQSIEIESDLI